MAHINDEIITTIRKSIELLRKNNISIKKAYLFGSFVTGLEHEWSDIDLALVSDDFSEDRHNERLRIMKITSIIDSRIEPATFRTGQFNDVDPLVWEIKNNGIEITN